MQCICCTYCKTHTLSVIAAFCLMKPNCSLERRCQSAKCLMTVQLSNVSRKDRDMLRIQQHFFSHHRKKPQRLPSAVGWNCCVDVGSREETAIWSHFALPSLRQTRHFKRRHAVLGQHTCAIWFTRRLIVIRVMCNPTATTKKGKKTK